MRRIAAAAGVAVAVAAAAGCGSAAHPPTAKPPRLPRSLAQSWARQADAVESNLASGDACAAKTLATQLQAQVVASINAHRVPRPLLEPLSSGVNELVARIVCVPAPPAAPGRSGGHGHGHGHGHDKRGNGEGD